jgi:hypothetical protein
MAKRSNAPMTIVPNMIGYRIMTILILILKLFRHFSLSGPAGIACILVQILSGGIGIHYSFIVSIGGRRGI